MPVLTTGQLFFPPLEYLGGTQTNITFGAVGDFCGGVFQFPQSGNVTGCKFATATVTTGCTVTIALETVGANGQPSGSLYNANATTTVVIANVDDNVIKTASFTSFAVNKGDTFALTIRVSSGTPASMPFRTFAPLTTTMPYFYKNIAAVGTYTGSTLCGCLTYDTGDVHLTASLLFNNTVAKSISNATSPAEIGMKFVMPFTATSDGCIWKSGLSSNAQAYQVNLYDSNSTVLATYVGDPNTMSSTGLNNMVFGAWATAVKLYQGQTYRVALTPTSAVTWTSILNELIGIVAAPLLTNVASYTQRPAAGSWTDTANAAAPIAISISNVFQPPYPTYGVIY